MSSTGAQFAQRKSQRKTAKLPVLLRYAPGQFEAEAEDVQASVADTLQAISKFDPTDERSVREAKKRNIVEDEDPEAEALKRRLYRYKYVRRIDDKLPTIQQLREKVQQQEEDDAPWIDEDDLDEERRGALHPHKTPEGNGKAADLRKTISDFRHSDEPRSTSTSWAERNAAARKRVDEEYLNKFRAVQKSKAKKEQQLRRHLDDLAMAARQ